MYLMYFAKKSEKGDDFRESVFDDLTCDELANEISIGKELGTILRAPRTRSFDRGQKSRGFKVQANCSEQ